MSTAENKAVIRRGFEEGINQRNPQVYDDVIAPTYVNHDFPAPTPGIDGFKQVISLFLTAFPDMQVSIEDALAEGDKVATRGVLRGTHHGAFLGIPPTGKPVAVKYIDIWRVENGTGVENWVQMDLLGLLQQLGAIPTPDQAPQEAGT
jgi:predicted ester cyclase